MKKIYNVTDIFNIYYININNQKCKIKTFSKEWWKFIWDIRPRFKIRIEIYYK